MVRRCWSIRSTSTSIVDGLERAIVDVDGARGELGATRAAAMTWRTAAERTADVYRELAR